MIEHGMGDIDAIEEIISEVNKDNVSYYVLRCIERFNFSGATYIELPLPAGWKDKL